MGKEEIIRAWKDSMYRASLSAEELAHLPENPVGHALSDDELQQVEGGGLEVPTTIVVCTDPTTETSGTTTYATTQLL